MKGLLDSGATHTILGGQGVDIIKDLGAKLNTGARTTVLVADGRECTVSGTATLPIELDGKVRVLEVLCVPSMSNTLILGLDFWKGMEIVPNIKKGRGKTTSESPSPKLTRFRLGVSCPVTKRLSC